MAGVVVSGTGLADSFAAGFTGAAAGAGGGIAANITAGITAVFEGAGGAASVTPGNNDSAAVDYPGKLPKAHLYWRERVANYSPWNDVFSVQEQNTQLVIDIPFENRYLFIPHAIGYSYVESNNYLRRVNPIRHPYWTWMRASRLAHGGVRFTGKRIILSGGGNTFAGGSAGINVAPYRVPAASTAAGVAYYQLARFTVEFANYPWDFKEDSEITDTSNEWQRNCYWEEQPTAQMLAAEGGAATLQFVSGFSGGPPSNTKYRAAFGTVVPQIRFALHWMWVPYDYVFSNRVPSAIYAAISKLNNSTAFGTFAKGTLLFEPPTIEKYVYPVRVGGGKVSYMCNITLPMVYMDPAQGSGVTDRGHNLMPWRLNNFWYPATRDGTSDLDNKGLFSYTDWTAMFRHV